MLSHPVKKGVRVITLAFRILVQTAITRGPRDHVHKRILHSDSKAQDKGIPETMVCRMLVFAWSLGPPMTGMVSGARIPEHGVCGMSANIRGLQHLPERSTRRTAVRMHSHLYNLPVHIAVVSKGTGRYSQKPR